MPNLNNLKLLYEDMKQQDWSITSFTFKNFYHHNYVVLVRRFIDPIKRKSKYALVQLVFLKESDITQKLIVEANAGGIIPSSTTEDKIKDFFDAITKIKIYGGFIQFLSKELNKFTPIKIQKPSDLEKECMLTSLNHSDSQDPRKKYCMGIRHDPSRQERSPFNSDKTKFLRPNLFKLLKNNKDISFRYSMDPNDEREDSDILKDL